MDKNYLGVFFGLWLNRCEEGVTLPRQFTLEPHWVVDFCRSLYQWKPQFPSKSEYAQNDANLLELFVGLMALVSMLVWALAWRRQCWKWVWNPGIIEQKSSEAGPGFNAWFCRKRDQSVCVAQEATVTASALLHRDAMDKGMGYTLGGYALTSNIWPLFLFESLAQIFHFTALPL